MTGSDPVVAIRDLSFCYPETVSGRRVVALEKVSLSISPGEFVLLTGPSGSGKSTLARCLNGLIPHATGGTMDGDVIICGMNTREFDVPEFAPHVGMVFQDPGSQLVTSDVESEIAFGLEIRNLPPAEIRAGIEHVLSLLQIGHLKGRLIRDLSWGERQRVAIASVIALHPPVLVMDEPLSGIDASASRNLAGLLLDLNRRLGMTILVFEHRTSSLLPAAGRVIAMGGGTIISDTPCQPKAATFEYQDPRAGSPSRPPEVPGVPSSSPRPGLPSLSLRDVWYRYPGSTAPVLDGITLDFYPGEVTILAGANGSGKTTLLKHCNGLLRPGRGSVALGAVPLAGTTVAAAARIVALLGQHADYQLFESTLEDEIAFGPRNLGRDAREIAGAVELARTRCSLGHIDPRAPPLGLSGGEKQRVAIAGILAMDTPVLVLDEPTFGLDPALKTSFSSVLSGLCRQGRTVIVATHDEEFMAACGNRIIRIEGGRIAADFRISPVLTGGRDAKKQPGGREGDFQHAP